MAPAHRSTTSLAPGAFRLRSLPAVLGAAASLSVALMSLSACQRDKSSPEQTPASEPPTSQASAEQSAAPVVLSDISESGQHHVVGITYPPGIVRHQGLAVELLAYAEKARADLNNALQAAAARKDAPFYDLSLKFVLLADTPELVAVAADGSSFLGGAHSVPLIERFVWLPQRRERLRAERLIADPRGWQVLSDYTRERLHADLSQRIDADELDPVERARILREAGRMIDAGTEPKAESYRAFEPLLTQDGRRMTGLRFVFPPYQVGPYTDATTTVDVPAALFLPYVAESYRSLFTAEAAPSPLPLQQDKQRSAPARTGG